ncbi:MAG TPA: hypothetical protein VN025_17580 [Candidatus Dormibacteraeota bacterium]|jgi:hypothetical protein|nr:hypothetical protein [Candidatus Dormibacteraeota bacterium]
MRLITLALLGILFCCPLAYGQASSADAKTLQSILDELRQVRQDLHTTAATVQRAQILLYRIRTQTDLVTRITQQRDQAHMRTEQLSFARTQNAARIKSAEEAIEQTQDPSARKELEDEIATRKSQLEQLANQEQENQTKETEYSGQLRLEQAKLDELEARLDQLERKLEGAAESSQRK